MKILNLYAGIGGNRKFFEGDVTAVEIDPAIADVYSNLYPDDKVVISDAHKYLEYNFSDFDFIWSSPPCQSHGQYRHNVGVLAKGYSPWTGNVGVRNRVALWVFFDYPVEGRHGV